MTYFKMVVHHVARLAGQTNTRVPLKVVNSMNLLFLQRFTQTHRHKVAMYASNEKARGDSIKEKLFQKERYLETVITHYSDNRKYQIVGC